MTQQGETAAYKIFEEHNSNSNNKLEPEEIQDLVDSFCRLSEQDSSLGKVKIFMDAFNQPVANEFTIPDFKTCKLRLDLDLEETIELAEACGADVLTAFGLLLKEKSEKIRDLVEKKRESLIPNPVAALDALLDKRYINDGTVHSFGGRYIFEEGFQLVHESNMTKACATDYEAEQTIKKYQVEEGVTASKVEKIHHFLVVREPDKKVLKSINYKPVDLTQLLYGISGKIKVDGAIQNGIDPLSTI